MRSLLVRLLAIGAFVAGAAAVSHAQQAPASGQKVDLGKREYDSNCASCHGLQGKGDGPTAPFLTKSAADLTTLTKKNNGVFPVARVYAIIDGGELVAAHGSRDMPTWGREYRIQAGEYYGGDVAYDPEVYVRTRILALVEYLHRLQAK